MIPLAVIVRDKLPKGTTKVTVPQGYDPVQAFFLDRAHKTLRVRMRAHCESVPVVVGQLRASTRIWGEAHDSLRADTEGTSLLAIQPLKSVSSNWNVVLMRTLRVDVPNSPWLSMETRVPVQNNVNS